MNKRIIIVSPSLQATSGVTNGNSQTAIRWASMLKPQFAVAMAQSWSVKPGTPYSAKQSYAAMVALHARRSATSIAEWAAHKPVAPLVVVLTGTDLYRDIRTDRGAQRSLDLATHLVVLQTAGLDELHPPHRAKASVLFQSAPRLPTLAKPNGKLRALMVGHLRDEKDPQTYWRAAARLQARTDIFLDHAGQALDESLGAQALACESHNSQFRFRGAMPFAGIRRSMQRAHVLVHASRMEGGAHVILEAVQSGTPVLASRIPGNVGMLGAEYAGYFELGDDAQLASLLVRCADDPYFLRQLQTQCELRAPLFEPAAERGTLNALMASLMGSTMASPVEPPLEALLAPILTTTP